MKKTTLAFFVAALLLVSFLLALFSIRNDTFTFDETAHIAAGYSYLTQKDYRLNPEHPPLIKPSQLAARAGPAMVDPV